MVTDWIKLDASFLLDDTYYYTTSHGLEFILDITTSDIKKIFTEYIKSMPNDEFYYILSTFYPKQRHFIKTRFSLIKKINISILNDFLLYILKKSMNFDILILNDITTIYNNNDNNSDNILVFFKENNIYKNVGINIDNKVVNVFNKSDLPPYLFNLELLIIEHLKIIIKSSDNITLNDIIRKINTIIKISDIKLLLKLIKQVLN